MASHPSWALTTPHEKHYDQLQAKEPDHTHSELPQPECMTTSAVAIVGKAVPFVASDDDQQAMAVATMRSREERWRRPAYLAYLDDSPIWPESLR